MVAAAPMVASGAKEAKEATLVRAVTVGGAEVAAGTVGHREEMAVLEVWEGRLVDREARKAEVALVVEEAMAAAEGRATVGKEVLAAAVE